MGAGAGLFVTNADYAGQLAGDFETWQLNTPYFSYEYSSDGTTFIHSFTWGRGGPLASLSRFRTNTFWTWDLCER